MDTPTAHIKNGDIVWNHGYEFTVTDLQFFPVIDPKPGGFTHQANYAGVCTDNPVNDSIRHTGYNGARYGFGVKF